MPEYLTPGVYVEETSFRSKSIEGVSTSTTAFVGPTRRGPINETPELLTSFADFERIFGGLGPLEFAPEAPNYLANSVRAYFDNGGARLYVARTYQVPVGADQNANPPAGHARWINGAGDARIALIARSPGSGGNGHFEAHLAERAVTGNSLRTAPEGSLVRTGGVPAGPARIDGGRSPMTVDSGRVLSLRVGPVGAEVVVRIEFTGTAAVLDAPDDVQVPLNAGVALVVRVDGRETALVLPAKGDNTPYASADEVAGALDAQLVGGRVEAVANRLRVTSDTKGTRSQVTVKKVDELGFTADPEQSVNGAGSVPDLRAVGVTDIEVLLVAQGGAVHAVEFFEGADARLRLVSQAVGDDVRLRVDATDGDAHTSLGLPTALALGSAGAVVTYFFKTGNAWARKGGGTDLDLGAVPVPAHLLTMNVTVTDADGVQSVHEDLGFGREHPRAIARVLAEAPASRQQALENALWLAIGDGVDAFELHDRLFASGHPFAASLTNGSDGAQQGSEAYRAALSHLRSVEGISIVAAPGYSGLGTETARDAVRNELVTHVERRRSYQIAVLDTAAGISVGEATIERGEIDSKYAATYYPWVVVANPLARPGDLSQPQEIALPPSGFVCGIYARNDVQRGVFKAPANEVVRGALRFEREINFDQQAILNPAGVNCLRFFPGRGYRVWGARLASSDPEWKYVSDRRYFNYLEASVDRGTQWAVFEPNGERLWVNVRDTVASFLYNEWKNGYLLGATVEQAFFVRCDRSTMTQNDLDNGRLVCLIGVAIIKPAEFVIFRIGQKTADARS